MSCPSTISQKAAEAALTGPRQPIEAMREAYVERAALAVKAAEDAGLRAYEPQGTIYMLLDVSDYGSDGGLDFALELLRAQQVSVAPGSVFGPGGAGTVRVSLAASETTIENGIKRMAVYLQQGRR